MKLSEQEIARYDRHLRLSEVGLEGQERLKQVRVLVVGAGGLGCPVLQYLSAAGVGTIGIVDGDRVDLSNLQRQVLYGQQDIGAFKVEAAIRRLSEQNPFVRFIPFNEHLSRENALGICKDFDILIDGSDNFPTRYLVADASVILDKPLVFGSIFKFEGQVSVFNYKGGPGYRCLFPEPPAPGEMPNCSEVGVLGVLPGFIGTRMAAECLKVILGIGEVMSGKLLVTDLLGNVERILRIRKVDSNWERKVLEENYEVFCGFPADQISVEELNTWMKEGRKFDLIDVREADEYALCRIPGSQLIPLSELVNRSNEVNPETVKVLYCHHGMRSAKAIEWLRGQKMDNLTNLTGGIHAWAERIDTEMVRY